MARGGPHDIVSVAGRSDQQACESQQRWRSSSECRQLVGQCRASARHAIGSIDAKRGRGDGQRSREDRLQVEKIARRAVKRAGIGIASRVRGCVVATRHGVARRCDLRRPLRHDVAKGARMRGRHHAGERHQQCQCATDEAPGASPSDVFHRAAIIRDGTHRNMIQVNRCRRRALPTTSGATTASLGSYGFRATRSISADMPPCAVPSRISASYSSSTSIFQPVKRASSHARVYMCSRRGGPPVL